MPLSLLSAIHGVPARGLRQRGFSLIELAIVLFIVALLLGGMLYPLATRLDQKRIEDTQGELQAIKAALIGYAVIHGYLPCPTYVSDPSSPYYGVAASSCSSPPATEGYLPWKTLGVAESDSWGHPRQSATDPWVGFWRYRVDRSFADPSKPIQLTTSPSDSIRVVDAAGDSLTTSSEPPVAIVFSTGPNMVADGENASFESTSPTYEGGTPTPNFDDITMWIGRPELFGNLVSAGRLP